MTYTLEYKKMVNDSIVTVEISKMNTESWDEAEKLAKSLLKLDGFELSAMKCERLP